MSEVNAADQRIINGIDDVIGQYAGAGAASKIGIEVELAFFDPDNMNQMSVCQNRVAKNAALDALPGDWVRNEPTSETLEVNSFAVAPDNLTAAMDDTNKKIAILSDKAAGIGLKRSYFQELPEKTAEQLLQSIVDVERYQAFFEPPRADMAGIAAYFSICKSNQVSVSYRDPDHMLENIRRLYYLAPFLFLLTDNSASFAEGQKVKYHPGMHYRSFLEGRGGVPPYVFTAKTGEEYIRAHIRHVMNNPLFAYYNEDGEIKQIPSGEWKTVEGLKDEGLNIASNYHLAESVLWPDVKIAALKDAQGEVINHRYEVRMLGVGMHQHQSAFLITAALAFNPECAQSMDRLLAEYGFDNNDLGETQKHLASAYAAARNHNFKFFDIAYGTGRMADFAKSFASIMEDTWQGQGFDEQLTPLLTICRTGYTDAKVNALLFDTLDKVTDFQKSYDPALMVNPNSCAYLEFENEIGKKSTSFRGLSINI